MKVRTRRGALRWAAGILVLAGAVLWFTRPSWHGIEVEVVAPTRAPVVETLVTTGRVRFAAYPNVTSTIAGRLVTLTVDAGETVTRGQGLATLDDADASASLARAEAARDATRAERADLEARRAPRTREELRQARADLAQAERELARDSDLAARGALTPSELQRTQLALTIAQSRARAAGVEVRALTGSADEALAARDADADAAIQTARQHLEAHTLRAPADGLVLSRPREVGDVIQPGEVILSLASGGPTDLVIEPDEKLLGRLRIGQTAIASADAFPEERLDARVTWIAPSVDPRRGTIEIRLALDAAPPSLKPDMTVSVEITLAERDEALTLPVTAIRDLATPSPWVLAIDGTRAVRRELTLGLRGDDAVEVLGGLSADAHVIPPSPGGPAEGARVRPRAEPR